jgi:hypothetical protein
MAVKINRNKILFNLGVILMIAGALDPMEGSVVIAAGTFLAALSAFRSQDRHKTAFVWISAAVIFGVIMLFWLSSLGGFGGTSDLSWWWGTLILPYPLGWLAAMGLLIYRVAKKA